MDYFTALRRDGGLLADGLRHGGDQLIAWGKESFTIEPCGLEGGSEFALVFDLSEGQISRVLVVEDLPSFIRAGRDQAVKVHQRAAHRIGLVDVGQPRERQRH